MKKDSRSVASRVGSDITAPVEERLTHGDMHDGNRALGNGVNLAMES